MSQVSFSREYNPVAEQILQYQRNYRTMSTAQRANGAIENLQDMNKVFANKLQDEMLGRHIDILA